MGKKYKIIVKDIYTSEDPEVRKENLYRIFINIIKKSEFQKVMKC